ncbi:uncharacterized protein [Dermacentor albipictus]|uniref:uncharacterized protein n=1 Tax=Dermacentor albipictus TaxID=60249 RepID=UPI0038FC329A
MQEQRRSRSEDKARRSTLCAMAGSHLTLPSNLSCGCGSSGYDTPGNPALQGDDPAPQQPQVGEGEDDAWPSQPGTRVSLYFTPLNNPAGTLTAGLSHSSHPPSPVGSEAMLGALCTGLWGSNSLEKRDSSSARQRAMGRLGNSSHIPRGGQPLWWRPPDPGGWTLDTTT